MILDSCLCSGSKHAIHKTQQLSGHGFKLAEKEWDYLNINIIDVTHIPVTIIVIINGQSLLSKVNLEINCRISSVMSMPRKYQSVATIISFNFNFMLGRPHG
jgi:hypothetical protein